MVFLLMVFVRLLGVVGDGVGVGVSAKAPRGDSDVVNETSKCVFGLMVSLWYCCRFYILELMVIRR